jgi:hypothetical protein
MSDLTVIEQQLISRITPCINVHLLNHGGIGSSGHCVTFSPLAVVHNTISNLLENCFQNILMKLAENKLISLIAQTFLMLFKKILIL